MVRILAVDVGTRRLGLALSDPLGLTAQPLPVLECRGRADAVAQVLAVVTGRQVERVVIGLPLNLDGTRGPAAARAEAFAGAIRARCGVPVALHDERFTSRQGERVLLAGGVRRATRRRVTNQIAAQLILQAYLEAQR